MPFTLPVIIGAISAAIGGTELGMQIAGVGKPSSGAGEAAKQAQDAQLKQAQADQQAKQKAILASLPNAQEQGGGALSAPSLTDLASVIAGMPGEATTSSGKGALNAFLGTPTGPAGNETMVGATYGLSGSQG
jgi:hypothetical protein